MLIIVTRFHGDIIEGECISWAGPHHDGGLYRQRKVDGQDCGELPEVSRPISRMCPWTDDWQPWSYRGRARKDHDPETNGDRMRRSHREDDDVTEPG